MIVRREGDRILIDLAVSEATAMVSAMEAGVNDWEGCGTSWEGTASEIASAISGMLSEAEAT